LQPESPNPQEWGDGDGDGAKSLPVVQNIPMVADPPVAPPVGEPLVGTRRIPSLPSQVLHRQQVEQQFALFLSHAGAPVSGVDGHVLKWTKALLLSSLHHWSKQAPEQEPLLAIAAHHYNELRCRFVLLVAEWVVLRAQPAAHYPNERVWL
jgi:hypothetical protein